MTEREIKTAVVTGATGAVGSAICRELIGRGIRVRAVCRPGTKRSSHLPNSELLSEVYCDMSELSRLSELIADGADAFFHLAWAGTIGPGRNDMPMQINNVRGAIDAVRAASALGCQVFIGAGSQAEYGRFDGILRSDTPCFPDNGYGMAKLCAGQMSRVEAHALGMAHIWPRILSVYGPNDGPDTMMSSAIRQLLKGEKPLFTAGEQMWDYLFSEDAAAAFVLMALHGEDGKVYPLGSGQSMPLKDYIIQLRDAVDPKLPLGIGEIPYGKQQVMHLQADISELSRDTGFSPKVLFRDGIKKTIASNVNREQL